MNDLLITLGSLVASLGNTQSAAVLRDHIGLIKTRLEQLEQRNKQLEEENADLVKRMHEMQQQIARDAKTSQYTEHRGALFERTASGTYNKTPRCPACHGAMFSPFDIMEYTCGKPTCGQIANFTGAELDKVLGELESL